MILFSLDLSFSIDSILLVTSILHRELELAIGPSLSHWKHYLCRLYL